MLSDETITNIVLHRDTRIDSNQVPFVVASTSTLRVSHPRQSISRRTITERVPSSRSSKSAVDAKNRAISDSCMAAAIGDLQWLKQSIRDGPIGNGEITSVEQTYGKEGLAPIHLAALHGRLNCLSYLVETVQTDVNSPSSTGWRPIHLCISKETGSRSYQCLQYLIAHGATVNIANQDLLTPLHQAASEGHVQCLELLLAHNADVYAEDCRKQLPIDLAKLWGHKKCAKMLAAAMWHQNKHLSAKERLLSRNNKMADLLLEIKREHAVLFEEKAEEKFDQWLINAGTGSAVSSSNNEVTKSSSSNSQILPLIGSEAQNKLVESNEKKTIPKRVFPSAYTSLQRWNSSTHVQNNPYTPNLTDAYPRDPFTKMPPKPEAVEIYRLLQKMSVADVKKFLQQRKEKVAKKKKGTRATDQKRPVVYAACHVDDIQTLHKPRKGEDSFQPLRRFDESALHLSNNAHKSVFFGQLIEALDDGENSFRVQQQQADEKAKWALFEQYGPELIEFLADRHGRFKKQFDKVFIT